MTTQPQSRPRHAPWLEDDRREALARERRLAFARAALAVVSLVAVAADSTLPDRFASIALWLLITYAFESVGVLLVLRRRHTIGTQFAAVLHGIDIVFAAMITIVSQGPSSPLFPLLVFVLIGTAHRWSFRATFITGLLLVALLLIEAAVVWRVWPEAGLAFEVNRLIIRCTYLLVIGYLVGYLAARERDLRNDASAVAELSGMVSLERGLSASLQIVFRQLSTLSGTRSWQVVYRDDATGRAYAWNSTAAETATPSPFQWHEIAGTEADRYLFEVPPAVVAFQAVRGNDPADIVWLDEEGPRDVRTADPAVQCVIDLVATGTWKTLIGLCVNPGSAATARVFFVEDAVRPLSVKRLARLHRVLRQIFPALYNLYLLRRLRARAGELERARVARELHDGVIQSLIGLELEVAAMRREAGPTADSFGSRLAEIQKLLHQEVLNVRDLMLHLRPVQVDARSLLANLSDIVERFRRESGVDAEFVSDLQDVDLPPRTCREIARILQEALVNVRKHSHAAHVVVRFAASGQGWLLSIDDDGRGFDFTGRLSHDALDAARKGPIVIKERVRSVGGTLTIESRPGRGSRLEIALPSRAHV